MQLGVVLLLLLSANLASVHAMLLRSSMRSSGSQGGSLASSFAARRPLLHSMRGARVGLRLFSQKPDFTREAEEKYFEYARLEKNIYEWWESKGYFEPAKDNGKKPYVIPMPPPNVTGYLHMGHAMFVALQDIMARFHRMRGEPTLWLPGTDHAGIATQLLVERQLKVEGTTRQEVGREIFLERVWQWKEEKGGFIINQMKRLGASADWKREKFTLEPKMSESVTEAFVQLYEKGLVYRGDYMVNWSPGLQTSVSDLEVDYVEETGTMYTFRYPLADGTGFIPVSTTRPETIPGDAAVFVHPEDPRYSQYVGLTVKVPGTDREIPVMTDEYVDREFGTGALKVTPAHDINDYELGKKHDLPMINILNKDATMNEAAGSKYAGMDRFECRKAIVREMEADGLMIMEEPHGLRVPRSQRGGEIIEPMVSSQWFVKMDNMAQRAGDAVRNGDIKIIPERFDKIWYGWLDNIRPWCVSRQLWWGHRIPAYNVVGKEGAFFVARTEGEAYEQARERYGSEVRLEQDNDVLDTWFSSGLWPFATLDWPRADVSDPTSDMARFYPASVLETGYDILFFWVARMVMMGLELTDKSPFETIYLHGLVRDGKGQKMSKTTGNVIDPLETIDQFGCDALRYSLVTGCTPGQDIPLSMERVESNRNFANKLWNAGKYLQMNLASLSEEEKHALRVVGEMDAESISKLPLAERYIVSRCHELVMTVTESLEIYSFGDAGKQIQEFLWDEYADWYIEVSKTRDGEAAAASKRVLVYVFDRCMRLLHPFMPFLTETLWQLTPHEGESLMTAPWPMDEQKLAVDREAISSFGSIQALVRTIRNARAEYNVEAGKKISAVVVAPSQSMKSKIEAEVASVALLGRIDATELKVVMFDDPTFSSSEMGKAVHLIVEDDAQNEGAKAMEAYLPLASLVDAEKEKKRLTKQAEKLRKDIAGLEGRLASKGFAEKAPPHILAEVQGNVAEKKQQLSAVEKGIDQYI